MSEQKNFYQSDDEIKTLVHGFEDCTLLDSEFNHRAHLTVALSYLHLLRLTVPEATERMRAGLYRFLDYYGHDRQKYNETITLFWIKLVRGFLNRTNLSQSAAELANDLIEACGNPQLIFSYYSKELLSSDEARTGWLEPDLKPLEFLKLKVATEAQRHGEM